jgi:hypothetical protein
MPSARAICGAVKTTRRGAARLVSEALASVPAGNAGWLLPIEPLLLVARNRSAWRQVLAILRNRATERGRILRRVT